MPSTLVFIVVTLALFCKELKASPSLPKKDVSFRIFNGTDAARGEFKSMVRLELFSYEVTIDIQNDPQKWNSKQFRRGSLCSGIILSRRFVMTASHCAMHYIKLSDTVKPPYVPALEIIIEANNTGRRHRKPQRRIATHNDLSYHPSSRHFYKYNETCHRNNVTICVQYISMHDIAIIKVNKPFDFSEDVGSVAILKGGLPRKTVLRNADIVGYGRYAPNLKSSGILRHAKATAGGDDYCEGLLRVRGKKWQHKVCAMGLNKTALCPGDSGGPIYYRRGSQEVAVGILCHAFPTDGRTFTQLICSDERSVTFYTSTSGVEEWVRKVTNGSSEIKYVTWNEINKKRIW